MMGLVCVLIIMLGCRIVNNKKRYDPKKNTQVDSDNQINILELTIY